MSNISVTVHSQSLSKKFSSDMIYMSKLNIRRLFDRIGSNFLLKIAMLRTQGIKYISPNCSYDLSVVPT